MSRSSRAFTLIETAATIAALGTLSALGVTALSHTREIDHRAACAAKLADLGAGSSQFALSHNGLMAGFTAGQGQVGNMPQHTAQAVEILRSRGRPDMSMMQSWIPDVGYWSLPLVEFQDRSLSDTFNICPRDANQLRWRNDPAGFDAGAFLPMQPQPVEALKRVPYMSSYRLTGGAFDTLQNTTDTLFSSPNVSGRVNQHGSNHFAYSFSPEHRLGPSPMSMVVSPSLKVHMFDEHQRHFPGVNLFFMYPKAIQPVLFFEGSVRLKVTQDARPSWTPLFPTLQAPTSVLYTPSLWEPPLAGGRPFPATEMVSDRYRWTRDGLRGWDFGN